MIGDLLEMSIIIAGYFLLFNAKVIWRGLKEIKTPAMLLDLIACYRRIFYREMAMAFEVSLLAFTKNF